MGGVLLSQMGSGPDTAEGAIGFDFVEGVAGSRTVDLCTI